MRNYIQLFSFYCIFLICASVPLKAMAAQTPDDVPDTCDVEYWEVMSSRAWMEGKRDQEMAQTIILKPDSVLEYSCFERRLDQLARPQPALFSDPADLDNALGLLVRDALNAYLNFNFAHDMAGGLFVGGPQATCNAMFQVWDFLKCYNFQKDDFFLAYDEVISADNILAIDPRNLPQGCNMAEPDRDDKWEDNFEIAFPDPDVPPELGGMHTMQTFLEIMSPYNCGASARVRTGLVLVGGGQDVSCVAPGCYFNGSTCIAN